MGELSRLKDDGSSSAKTGEPFSVSPRKSARVFLRQHRRLRAEPEQGAARSEREPIWRRGGCGP